MSWKCGACGRHEGDRMEVDDPGFQIEVNAVCHHCGTPLCNWHRDDASCQYWIDDEAFAEDTGDGRRACHCRACLHRHHPGGRIVDPPTNRG